MEIYISKLKITVSGRDILKMLFDPQNKKLLDKVSSKLKPRKEENPKSEGKLLPVLKKCQKLKKKHIGRKKRTTNPVTGKRYYHPRKKKEIGDPLESVKFESNIPCTVTGKKYRTAENNPFL